VGQLPILLERRPKALEAGLHNGTGGLGSIRTKLIQYILEFIHRVLVAANAFLNQGLVTGSGHHLLELHKGTMRCTGHCSALIRIPAKLRYNGLRLLSHILTVLTKLPECGFKLWVLCIVDRATKAINAVLHNRDKVIEPGRNVTCGSLVH
jgi:hypothetical protein